MTELKQRVILVPIILQIMSSPTFIRQESLPYIKEVTRFLLLWRHATSLQRFLLLSSPNGVLVSLSCMFSPYNWSKAAWELIFEFSLHLMNLDMSCSGVFLNFLLHQKKKFHTLNILEESKWVETGRYETVSEWVFNSLISRGLHRLCICISSIVEHDLPHAVLNACCRILFSRIWVIIHES